MFTGLFRLMFEFFLMDYDILKGEGAIIGGVGFVVRAIGWVLVLGSIIGITLQDLREEMNMAYQMPEAANGRPGTMRRGCRGCPRTASATCSARPRTRPAGAPTPSGPRDCPNAQLLNMETPDSFVESAVLRSDDEWHLVEGLIRFGRAQLDAPCNNRIEKLKTLARERELLSEMLQAYEDGRVYAASKEDLQLEDEWQRYLFAVLPEIRDETSRGIAEARVRELMEQSHHAPGVDAPGHGGRLLPGLRRVQGAVQRA